MASPTLPSQDDLTPTTTFTTPRTILVVEDDADVRGVLVSALEDAGYRVDTAADGLTALHGLRSHRPDAIILDLMLPAMDGRQFLRACRADAETRDIPVLILSAAYGAADDPELGSLVVVAKPFDVDLLLFLVEDALS
jgi:CheY-like chemotaxis protein